MTENGVSNGVRRKDEDSDCELEVIKTPERDTWSGKLDFLMSSLSFAVGMGNMWRFPYLCYRNGGGAFLVPYIIMMIFAGLPMMFLEFCFGQYGRLGVVSIWKVCPLFKGVGWSMFMVSFVTSVYYNMLNAWCIYYIVSSFARDVPWRGCSNWWNTEDCGEVEIIRQQSVCSEVNGTFYNMTCFQENTTQPDTYQYIRHLVNTTGGVSVKSPSDEYFHHQMLQTTSSITDFGTVNIKLALSFLFVWALVCVCLIKGIKSSGKATYFTSLFPYAVLLILFVRGVTLDGATDGIIYYLKPDWSTLIKPKVWVDAGIQVFFSLSTCWGGLITLASYNSFHSNSFRDAVFVSTGDCLTSIFGGVVVFSFIGYMASVLHVPIDEVATQGAGLAFIIYPEAVTTLPLSPLWSVLFMLMLLNVGIGTQFGLVTTVHTTILDVFSSHLQKGNRPTVLLFAICVVCYILGFPLCTGAGIYILQLMDSYSATYALIFNGIMLCVALMWVYGGENFQRNIRQMLGHDPNIFFVICWKFISPVLLVTLLVFVLLDFKRTSYGDYTLPVWCEGIGWFVAGIEILIVPVVAVSAVYQAKGDSFRQKIRKACTPSADWFKKDSGQVDYDVTTIEPLTEFATSDVTAHA